MDLQSRQRRTNETLPTLQRAIYLKIIVNESSFCQWPSVLLNVLSRAVSTFEQNKNGGKSQFGTPASCTRQ